MTTFELLRKAAEAKNILAESSTEVKNKALTEMAKALKEDISEILTANAEDIKNATESMSSVMLDRLTLTSGRIAAMADAVLDVVRLEDPIGIVSELYKLPKPFGAVG